MPLNVTRIRTLISDVPKNAKLAYCLYRDERVPVAPKVALAAAAGVIVSPLDIPRWVPVFGELDMLALGVLAVKVFVDACPEDLVAEHQAALKARQSTFDDDWRAGLSVGRQAVATGVRRVLRGRRLRVLAEREDRSA